MDAEKDYNLLSEIMHNANIGWWKADIQDADYIYYGPIASLLGLEEGGCISFEKFQQAHTERGTAAYYRPFLRQHTTDE